jgi:hypothetical protein
MMNNASQQQSNPIPPPAPVPTPPPPGAHIPARAALCAIIPGIGAVYNREYIKAVIHLTIFAALAYIGETASIGALAAASFYVFTIFDAYRSAEAIARRAPEKTSTPDEEVNLPLWGGILVLLGVLFLLDNLGAIRLRAAMEFWPLLLIFLGVYLIFSYVKRNEGKTVAPPDWAAHSSPPSPQSGPPASTPATNAVKDSETPEEPSQ